MSNSLSKITVVLLAAVFLAGCGSGASEGTGSSSTTQPDDSTTTSADEARSTTTTMSSDVSVPDDVVEAAIEQAVRDTGFDDGSLEVVFARQVVWSDASLDCPEEGQSYIQVLTDGYRVVLDGPEGELDYRSSMDLEFTRCQNGQDPHSTQPDD